MASIFKISFVPEGCYTRASSMQEKNILKRFIIYLKYFCVLLIN